MYAKTHVHFHFLCLLTPASTFVYTQYRHVDGFYRALRVVLARYCYRKSSVRPSVCPSVTLMYPGHRGWTSSKLITRIISLGLRSSEPQHRQSSPMETPLKFRWNMGGIVLSRKLAISLKRGKIGPIG